jgi:hypothetical protein
MEKKYSTNYPEARRKWNQQNKDKIRAAGRRRYNKHGASLSYKRQTFISFLGYREKSIQMFLDVYGHTCSCCGESNEDFLTVEHREGGGTIDRRKNGTYGIMRRAAKEQNFDKYSTLCMNCNHAKGRHGYCSHQFSHYKGPVIFWNTFKNEWQLLEFNEALQKHVRKCGGETFQEVRKAVLPGKIPWISREYIKIAEMEAGRDGKGSRSKRGGVICPSCT